MRILTTQYSLSSLSIDIYFAGCSGPHCFNCHNPETHDPTKGDEVSVEELSAYLISKSKENPRLVTQVMFMGGEPTEQPTKELLELAEKLKNAGLKTWLFTRKIIAEIDFSIRNQFDYIKTGRYIDELKGNFDTVYGVTLASSNQKILKKGKDY